MPVCFLRNKVHIEVGGKNKYRHVINDDVNSDLKLQTMQKKPRMLAKT